MGNHRVAQSISHLSRSREGMLSFQLLGVWRDIVFYIHSMRSVKRSTDWKISSEHLLVLGVALSCDGPFVVRSDCAL